MDPLQMFNNDMSDLLMAVKPIMESWNDHNSSHFEEGCIYSIRNRYNQYVAQVNTMMRTLLTNEQRVTEELRKIQKINNNLNNH